MRALSVNVEAARLMGIRTGRVIALTFVTGSIARGARRGALLPRSVAGLPDDGRHHRHARLRRRRHRRDRQHHRARCSGGVLIGIIGELTKLTPYSGLQDVLVFTVLIGVLLVRPTGLLGKAGHREGLAGRPEIESFSRFDVRAGSGGLQLAEDAVVPEQHLGAAGAAVELVAVLAGDDKLRAARDRR